VRLRRVNDLIINASLLFVFIANGLLADTVVFTKADSADWTLEQNQDRITDNVWLTRKHTQSIFNFAQEAGYSGSSGSPVATLWSDTTTAVSNSADYTSFVLMHGGSPSSIINHTVSLYLPQEDLYFDVTFSSYSGGNNGGGGFSYSRTSATPTIALSPDSLSADLHTGETETLTLTITNNGDSDLNWDMEIDWGTLNSVTFTKADYADWTLAANQDRVTDYIWITRANNSSIFNAYSEDGDEHPHQPEGTEWAAGSFDDIGSVVFENFGADVLGHSVGDSLNNYFIPNNLPILMHLIEDDVYYEVYFHSWTTGGQGGGFSYTRVIENNIFDAISISPQSGTVSAGSSLDVDIIIDANGLFGDEYYADIIVSSNDPDYPEVAVPLHLSVTSSSDIWVDQDTLDFGEVYVNYDGSVNYGATLELTLGNDGTDILNVSSISVDNTAFVVSQNFATIDYDEEIILDVIYTTTGVGTDNGTITIVSDDPDEGIVTIPVYANALEPPVIAVEPDSISVHLNTGETVTQTATITNSGVNDLRWNSSTDWNTLDSFTFTKDDYADWSLPENQDRVADNVWITRGDIGAIFNAFNEMFGWHPHGPDAVEWAIGTFEEIDTLIFDTDFVMMLGHNVGTVLNGDLIPNNKPMVMHLIEDDIYYEVQFHSWTESGQGGGFSYTRTRKYDAIHMSPESGTVSAGSSSDVDIIFDASGMFGGEYSADIIVSSNDPVSPEEVLSAQMSVVGAGDIWADPDTADFGEIYVNYAGAGNYGGTLELTLGNDGTDTLNISSITVDNTSFTVSQSSASINYDERIMLDVGFSTADGVGAHSGTITIASDDPDQATFTIPVYVNAVEPPVITASPDALSADLNVGDTLDQVIAVTNSGASDLIYEIDLYNQSRQQSRRSVASQVDSRRNPIPFKGNFDVLESETRQKYRRSLQKLNNTVGNDDSERSNHARHSRDASRSWQLLYTDANESVLTIDVGNVYGDINEEELLIKWDSYVGWTNTSGIATMFIYIDADQDPSTGRPMWEMVPSWNIGAEGMIVRYHDNWAKLVHFAYDPLYGEWVGYDVDTLTTNSVEPYGNEVILGVNKIYFDGTYTTYNVDGINFGMVVDNLNETNVDIVPSWAAAGATPFISFDFSPKWLSFDLQTGVIPAGSSQDIIATLNSSGMLGGEYFADIVFFSNDPLNPNYSISAQMNLTGIPDISVLDETVDFGISYADYSDQASFALENTGTDVLEIENITTDSENLTVAVTSFEISPLETDSIHLSLVGTDLGDFSANVTITSNDPDQPTLTVPVTSIIVVAPNIGTDPEAFDLTVESGETISETLTIANTGGSDLDFDVEVEYTNRDQDGGGHDDLLTNTELQIRITTDDWPNETSWDLYTSSGEYIDGIVPGDLQWTNTENIWDVELQPGDYVFTIYDAWGDGICCLYGSGEYSLYLDGSLIGSGGEFGAAESVHFSAGSGQWLSIDPPSGVVAADASTDIMLNVDASSLDPGNYNGEIYIISNDPDNGYVTIPLSVTVNGMSSENEALLPEEFALHQNYPNPFNPVTTLRYDLPENSMVNIKVYDMLGREVRTLVNQVQDAGFKSIIWDATNDYGKSISAGIYLYQIQAGDFIQTEKMVLLK